MKLQTTIPLGKGKTQIDYKSKLLLLGSCFVENIGQKLSYYKFQQVQNPFGILFHPLAIENLIERALHDKMYQENEVFEHQEIWKCFDAHSDCSALSKQELLQNLNDKLRQTKKRVTAASHIVITLGTAWVYRNTESDSIVANCHKVPQKQFSKELLSVKTIQGCLERLIHLIQSINEKATLIFTISPVRHLKDGFVENQRSKANLVNALHYVKERHTISYFPSYEIMMDELRDYRFYEKDMVHPNQLAIAYIWEKFKSVWIAEEAYSSMEEVETVQKGLLHKPFNPNSNAHQKFAASLQAKIVYLQEKYPFIQF
ncbi:GSCFA domain-containing protein [Flagellimonas sp. HMM57]|uniref:GSCFA domain-containing protein n=1 Tax=unclassified Flagellimonas TaxID=2644544 RepID=UPI0013D487F2|nr:MULTISPECIES: GSCFA domain-containing protein [unclassified Flagellimonas]UII74809.1 GSCFA domain-containing protein [Flagellimonas sp. HMM57]